MKITHRHDVPVEKNNHVVDNLDAVQNLVKKDFAKDISEFLPTPTMKGEGNENIFFEESLYVYTVDKIMGISGILKGIMSSTDISQIRAQARLVLNHLHSEEKL